MRFTACLLIYHNNRNETPPEVKKIGHCDDYGDGEFERLCEQVTRRKLRDPWMQVNIYRGKEIVFILSRRELDHVHEVAFRRNGKWYNVPVDVFRHDVLGCPTRKVHRRRTMPIVRSRR